MDRSTRLNRTLLIGGSIAATIALGGFVYSIIQNRKQPKQETNAASNNNHTNPTNQPAQPSTTPTSTSTTPQENSGSETRKTVVIGTRSSQLALWQAHYVQELLQKKFPDIDFVVEPMNTMGDKDQIKPLSDFGSKGVFTKELDIATLNNNIQLAVHCVKDLPTTLKDGLYMGAILERGDVEDVLVLPISHPKYQKGSFEDLPDGALIGTSAMRRMASVAKYWPKLKCDHIRGNVNTRLAKLDRGEYSALLLARAGLMRLGLSHRISQTLDPKKFGYAVGQGALGIVCRTDDMETRKMLESLDHTETRWACEAERGVLRKLQGGCKVPIAIRTTIDNASKHYIEEHPHTDSTGIARTLHVWCSVMSMDGKTDVHATLTETLDSTNASGCGPEIAIEKARQLGQALGEKLLHKGADKLLEGIVDREGQAHHAPTQTAQQQ